MNGISVEERSRWEYHDLMLHRIHEILLVASPYDAYILEEDGRLTEQILNEYLGMNLSYAPRAWRASTASQAMDMLSARNYDLVIALLRISDMDPISFAGWVKEKHPDIPVVLLAYDASEVSYLQDHIYGGPIDKVFVWSGNASVFPVIIKVIEDRKNAERDILRRDVRAIVVVEDNPEYYSRILPRIYSEVLYHTRALMDQSLNATHRLLRLRARPKILFCSTYEEAQEYVRKFKDNLLGIISDIRFPRNEVQDDRAGLKLAEWVRELDPHMPFVLQSSRQDARELAEELGVEFINKTSNTLLQELREFMKENFGFGDFVFRDESGKEVARATNMLELEESLGKVPDSSIAYHATRNHFSNWLAARGEFSVASRMRPVQISDFPDMAALRQYLIQSVETTRHARRAGRVEEYVSGPLDPSANFIRIRGGSLGGKARGLAFANSLIESSELDRRFPEITIRIPRTVVIGTDEFDEFMERNKLWDMVFGTSRDEDLIERFVSATLSEGLTNFLKLYLKDVKVPLAVRSSGLLEDMQYRSLAGMYATYMVPNVSGRLSDRVRRVSKAIKLVYASTFSQEAKSTAETLYQRLEDEKMGVLIQELVGQTYGTRFYPTFSGVARSLNYYPVSYMKREEGIVYMALGLGRTVVEGGKALRFSPRYPTILPQFYSTEAMLENSQTEFYALDL
ncbi:MAG: PEP/pyruvate-binding domain-containing protein, partial [Fidelibacterota bacterium]